MRTFGAILLRRIKFLLFLLVFLFFWEATAHSFQPTSQEGVCGPEAENAKECGDVPVTSGKTDPFPRKKEGEEIFSGSTKSPAAREFTVYFFWGRGCPHCEEEKLFLADMKRKYPHLKIIDYEVWYNKQNAALMAGMVKAYKIKTSAVPVTFIDKDAFVGFARHSREEMAAAFQKCSSIECIDPALVVSGAVSLAGTVNPGESPGKSADLECTEKSKTVYIPWIGNLDTSEMSLPVITLVIAGMDSFNPCAFFVLFSLLGLLIHARSRFKIFLIGTEFIFFSGFIYFLFMTAWLNVFLIMGEVESITKIAGVVAVIIAAINIKDFFAFKKGLSLTIPDSAKPKLFDRMRKLMKSTSLLSIIIGTAVLAIAANSYELLCTAGFPMVYTRILTLKHLSPLSYYLYLALYNVIYVVPLSIIVIVFTVTLGRKILTEQQGRVLKLISGTMMLGLGGVLLFNPALLNNALISFFLLAGTLLVSVIIVAIVKKSGYSR
jgi:hypothetical protein